MATYRITFVDPDPYSERNGEHAPLASGAAFIATYGDGLTIDDCGEARDILAGDIDDMAIGEAFKVESSWCDSITVERIA